MKSAVYEGVVTHRRHDTDSSAHVAHAFDQRLTMIYLVLDELQDVFALHPLWSTRHRAPIRFRRDDYLGDPATDLDVAVRDVVQDRLGRRPTGSVAMLTQLRTWGWLFNPLTVFYCFDETATRVEALVLEVTSTPWHERHVYVIDGEDLRPRFAKEMHVSPFLGRDHDYVMTWSTPAERLHLHLGNRRGDERIFDANLTLERRDVSRAALAGFVWRRPLQTYGVSANIYRQAWRLWRKGATFHPRRRAVPHAAERESTGVR